MLRLWCYALSATSRRLATVAAHLLYTILREQEKTGLEHVSSCPNYVLSPVFSSIRSPKIYTSCLPSVWCERSTEALLRIRFSILLFLLSFCTLCFYCLFIFPHIGAFFPSQTSFMCFQMVGRAVLVAARGSEEMISFPEAPPAPQWATTNTNHPSSLGSGSLGPARPQTLLTKVTGGIWTIHTSSPLSGPRRKRHRRAVLKLNHSAVGKLKDSYHALSGRKLQEVKFPARCNSW